MNKFKKEILDSRKLTSTAVIPEDLVLADGKDVRLLLEIERVTDEDLRTPENLSSLDFLFS